MFLFTKISFFIGVLGQFLLYRPFFLSIFISIKDNHYAIYNTSGI